MRIVNLSQLNSDNWVQPQTLVVYTTQAEVQAETLDIRKRFPELLIIGVSSYHGIMTPDGYRRGSYGILFEASDNVQLDAKLVDLSQSHDVRQTICQELAEWKTDQPSKHQFIIHGIKGYEERIIEGLVDCFGPESEIFGATAGNDCFLKEAYVFLNDRKSTQGVLIVRIINHKIVSSITRSGYLTTLHKGKVTDVDRRILKTIDNAPASDVYNLWTERRFDSYISRGGDLPRSAGLYPIAHDLDSEPECNAWLVHPYFVDKENGYLHLYAEIPKGANVCLMRGSEDTLIPHVGTAIHEMISQIPRENILAAFILYCAGCASIIAENMPRVCQMACQELKEIPFIGCMSFGEQGRFKNARQCYHGNMMIELVLVIR